MNTTIPDSSAVVISRYSLLRLLIEVTIVQIVFLALRDPRGHLRAYGLRAFDPRTLERIFRLVEDLLDLFENEIIPIVEQVLLNVVLTGMFALTGLLIELGYILIHVSLGHPSLLPLALLTLYCALRYYVWVLLRAWRGLLEFQPHGEDVIFEGRLVL